MSTLDRVREENATTEESKTYYSIIRTGQLIPYDSAIFLSTDKLPNDTEHQQPASMILLKKRIRVSTAKYRFHCDLFVTTLRFTALSGDFRREESCGEGKLVNGSAANWISGPVGFKNGWWCHLRAESRFQARRRNGFGELSAPHRPLIMRNWHFLSLQITLVVKNRLKPLDSELREVYENELKSDNTVSVGENEETTSIH